MSMETDHSGDLPIASGLTPAESAVAGRLQGSIPLAERPFQTIAEEICLTEAEVLAIAGRLRERGIIRKFGAIVRHQLAGYTHNVMVVLRSIEEFKKVSMEYF